MEEFDFDLNTFLDSQGLTLNGVEKEGILNVQDKQGNQFEFNVNQYLASQKLDPKKVKITQVNSPKTAIPVTDDRVGLWDRFAMSFGNKEGSIAYLKNKFDDVSFDEEKGITLKGKDGVWRQIDPSVIDDPTDFAADLVEGIPTIASAVATTAASAAAGTAGLVASPVGALAAGAAAGAATGGGVEALRVSMGKIMGTYKATNEEFAKDVATEALMSLGGEAVGVGVKAGAKVLGKALRPLKDAAPRSKEILSEFFGKQMGIEPEHFLTAIDNPELIEQSLKEMRVGAKYSDDAISNATRSQIKELETALPEAATVLRSKYSTELSKLHEAAGKTNYSVNLGEIATDHLDALKSTGLIKEVPIGKAELDPVTLLPTSSKVKYELATTEDLARQFDVSPDQLTDIVPPQFRKEIGGLVNELTQYKKAGSAQGKQASEAVMKINTILNSLQRSMYDPTKPQLGRYAKVVVGDFQEKLANTYAQAGLGAERASLSNIMKRQSDALFLADKVKMGEANMDMLLNKVLKKPGSAEAVKEDIEGLLVEAGMPNLITKVKVMETAKQFAPVFSRKQSTLVGSFMPNRAVLGTLDIQRKLSNTLLGKGETFRRALLNDPEALARTLQTMENADKDTNDITDELLRQGGMK